jgi:hypothetical protein
MATGEPNRGARRKCEEEGANTPELTLFTRSSKRPKGRVRMNLLPETCFVCREVLPDGSKVFVDENMWWHTGCDGLMKTDLELFMEKSVDERFEALYRANGAILERFISIEKKIGRPDDAH